MKNKIAVIKSGFVSDYLGYFINLCIKNNICIDLFSLNKNSITSGFVNKTFILNSKYNPKDFKSRKYIENEIKNLVDINSYDYILSDFINLSFTCNVFHIISLNQKIKNTSNFLYRKILEIGHYERLKYEKDYYRKCPKIIVVSNYLKKDYSTNCNINPDKISVVYPGKNNKNFNYEKKKNNNEFILGAITCGFVTKGGYIIINALKLFRKKYPNIKIKLRIVNPKYKKFSFLSFYMKINKLDKIVEILPYQQNINEFYNTLDCFICASNNFEAFGRVATEAMSCKIPVIAGSNTGVADIIKDGINGFIFSCDKYKYSNLAEKIYEVIIKKDNLTELKINAEKISNELNWENFAKNIFYSLYPDSL